MQLIDNLKDFGLTINQATLLKLIIQLQGKTKEIAKNGFSYRDIKAEYKNDKDLYWELIDDLLKLKIISVVSTSKPRKYKYEKHRLEEIIKDLQKNNKEIQDKFDHFILLLNDGKGTENLELKTMLNFLQSPEIYLNLNYDQALILDTLFLKEDGKFVNILKSTKEIISKLKGFNQNKIRYNLSNLEKSGLIKSIKMGRIKKYRPLDLKTILLNMKNIHQKNWNNKIKQMQDTIKYLRSISIKNRVQQAFEEEKSKASQPIIRVSDEKYDLIDFGSDTINWVFGHLENAKKEILLDFRMITERNEMKLQIAGGFYRNLINFLRNKSEIQVKILIYVDDWLINKLEPIFSQVIQLIPERNFEFRVPIDTGHGVIRIIIDETTLISFMVRKNFLEFDKILFNKNKMSATEERRQFFEIWEKSFDIRDELLDHSISNSLYDVIQNSFLKKPTIQIFGKQSITLTGYKRVHNILLNLCKHAKSDILVLIDPLSLAAKPQIAINEISQRMFQQTFLQVLEEQSKSGVNIKLLCNTIDPFFPTDFDREMIKRETELLISLAPVLQIRQVDLHQYQLMIFDKSTLVLLEFLDSDHLKLILIKDPYIIDKFYAIFNKAWDESFDIRITWSKNQPKPFKNYLKNSFQRLDLQVTLPKPGETKIFDGKFTRYIIKHLMSVAHNEVLVLESFSDYYYNVKDPEKRNAFARVVLSYGWEVIKAIITRKIKAKVLVSYLPIYLKAITFNNLKYTLDLYPQYHIRFLPPTIQSNTIHGIYDDYITIVVGDLVSKKFQFLVINDRNLANFYTTQFNEYWNKSIELRQIFLEYGTLNRRKLVKKSIENYSLENEFHPMQVRKLYPKS